MIRREAFKFNLAWFYLIALFAALLPISVHAEITNATPAARMTNAAPAGGGSHLLQFLDGAALHGRLRSMDTNQGIQWEYPAARNVIKFQPARVASIKFENAQRVSSGAKPTCWFRFTNGDEVFGRLKSLDRDTLRLETWFGGDLEAPRDALQSVTFFPKGYAVLYEGPSGPDGWIMAQGQKGWRYKESAFVANGVGTLGRNLGLTESCSLEFDLSWSGYFSLSFIMFTDAVDRFDYSVSSYMFHMAPGYVTLQRVQTGTGVMSLGHQAQVPDMLKKNKVRIEIRVNREDATIAMLMDGVPVSQWKDHAGFVAKGKGIVFSTQMDGSVVKISRIRAAEWNGAIEPRPAASAPADEDMVYLANRDKVAGELRGIRDGKVGIAIPQTTLEIPIERVTQIFAKKAAMEPSARKPWELRCDVAGGGSVAFQLENWSANQISGTSQNFGKLAVNLASVLQIQFNLNLQKQAEQRAAPNIDAWDLDE